MAQGMTPDGIAWIAAGKPDPDSPSLLFIHGAGANSAAWWQQFEAFSHDRHCIAYDLAGFGASKPIAGTNLRAEMVNAAAEVMAAAGARQAHLVCQSLGGWTGLRLALDRPELVASLALSCTLAGIAHGPGLAAFQQAVAKMDERGPASLGLGEEFESAHPLKASLYRQLGALNPQQDPALSQRLFAPDFLVSLSQLKQVAAPTLILTGGDDRIWPPESLEGLSAHFVCAKFTVIWKSGHSPYFERPAQFNQAIADFVGSTRTASMASKKLTGMGLFGYSRFERTLDQGSAFPSLSYIENSTNQFASSFRMARQKAITFHFPPAVMALT